MAVLSFTEKQSKFTEAVFSGQYSRLLYGGAMGGGKTVCALGIVFMLCRIFPGSRWAIVRKDLPRIKRNVIPSFNKFRPAGFVGDINQSTWTATCTNGSQILFFPEGIKGDVDLDRWKGLEVNGFILEEANELHEKSYHMAEQRAGRWSCRNQPPPLILMTCNPARNWVKRRFYDPWKTGGLQAPLFYMPAQIIDNPHLDDEYIKSLEQLKESSPETYRRFIEGDWEIDDHPNQLIKYEWVKEAMECEPVRGKKRLGCDIARYGNDDTAICETDGRTVVSIERHHGLSVDQSSDMIGNRIVESAIDADRVIVDGVGLGAGVVDNLKAGGFGVYDFIGGAKPIQREETPRKEKPPLRYYNLRAQAWWEYREGLRLGEICIDIEDKAIAHRLAEDLTAPRYWVNSDKVVKIESKDDFRKRLGRSPDVGDAAVLADFEVPPPNDVFVWVG